MRTSGFFDLQTPRDLLEKARRDLQRFQENPLDTDAAFNFFVTIRQLPDWLHPGDGRSAQRKALYDKYVEFRIARHLGDSAKHFEARRAPNNQVEGTSVAAAYQSDAFQPAVFQGKTLMIKLDPKDPNTASFGEWIHALNFARGVFAIAELVVNTRVGG